jgi:hypothetical protein
MESQQLPKYPTSLLQATTDPQLTLKSFDISDLELKEVNRLKSVHLGYMLLKVCADKDGDRITLSDFRSFLSPKDVSPTSSKINYKEIINENPDSDETMLHVVENVLEEFKKASQECVIVVGDKQYKAGVYIYGQSLNKLLIYSQETGTH